MSIKVLVIAALEREVASLVRGWRVVDEGIAAAYRVYEKDGAVVVCAGIGPRPARRAAESALSRYEPEIVISAGLAGALTPDLTVGDQFIPDTVVNSATGSRIATGKGNGVLISASGIAGPEAKRLLARQFGALAVDMEAAAVGEAAQRQGIPFVAVKAISDAYDFPLPDMEPFVDVHGRFLTAKFVSYTAMHPGMWGTVRKLASNSAEASGKLCSMLHNLIVEGEWQQAQRRLRPTVKPGETRVP
jgi:adenosylhomocysteine nucleosidase